MDQTDRRRFLAGVGLIGASLVTVRALSAPDAGAGAGAAGAGAAGRGGR